MSAGDALRAFINARLDEEAAAHPGSGVARWAEAVRVSLARYPEASLECLRDMAASWDDHPNYPHAARLAAQRPTPAPTEES